MPYDNFHQQIQVGPGRWIFMAIVMVLFWSFVVFLVLVLLRRANHWGHRHGRPHGYYDGPRARVGDDEAVATLKMRLAKGEIGEDEFKSRMSLLQPNP